MMLCVVIKGPSFEEAHRQIVKALAYADLIELRLDGFEQLDLVALKRLRSHFSIPMIFTLRSQRQGGRYLQSEDSRLAAIRHLVTLKPDYLDLEHHVLPRFVEEISFRYPAIKLILSYHDFTETSKDLEGIYRKMRKLPASLYKIAVTSQHSLDALRLISWAKKKWDDQLIAIGMGSHGQVSRILAPVIRCPITYASFEEDQKTALGQLSAKTLYERYHHHALNPQTVLYGLIGDPVDQSISDETHNHLITVCGINAVYVKIRVSLSELADFLRFAHQLSFRGLSVTMPLKEAILPYLDEIDPQALAIGAVNTLLFENGKIFGCNTDGVGALNAIEKEYLVKDKRIVIIGAGGAAKAIAYEALRRGALVMILNREAEKARQVAQRLHCRGQGLDAMAACAEAGYDILINCTPAPLPIAPATILSQALVMDIVTKPKETAFLQQAREKGCRIIYGYRMFVEQAIGQWSLWFRDRMDSQESRKILESINSPE